MTVVANNKNLVEINYIPPDGGWGWVIVFSSLIIHFIMDGITYSLGTYLTAFTETFNISHGQASLVHSLLPAVTLSCGPIASIFTNNFGCRKTTIYGTLIASFGFIISYFVKNFFLLYVTIGIIVGLGFGLIYVPAIVSVGYYFESKRSLAIGIAVCGSGIGTFVLSPINRILVNRYGINGAFLIKAAIVLNLCICGLLIRPVPIEPSEIKKNKKKAKENNKFSSEVEKKDLLNINYDENVIKNGKIAESMPTVFIDNNLYNNNIKKALSTNQENNLNINTRDLNEFAKSLPMLTSENNQNLIEKNIAIISESKSQFKKSTNSTFDLMAHVRSLQNITQTNASRKSLNLVNLNQYTTQNLKNEKNNIEEKKSLKEKIQETVDLSLLKNLVFIFFSISNFLTSLGFNTPFIYIVDQATNLGIEPSSADLLLSTIGISNTIGRVVLGIISDIKGVNRLYLYAAVLTICGIATALEPFFTSFLGLFIYSMVFGFTSGGYVSLTSVLLVDLLGLEKLTNAFGILLVFQGIATSIGPPGVGILYDINKSYILPFILTGTLIGISGFMCFFIPLLKK